MVVGALASAMGFCQYDSDYRIVEYNASIQPIAPAVPH
jgi:hypothetical protein